MKILFVVPHLSTGGLPQYVLKQLETFFKKYDIYLIEYQSLSNTYVVQRNKIKSILKHKYFLLQENKQKILSLIRQISPDIIHFQDVPEIFMEHGIAKKIFSKDRSYNIICTTHSSQINPENISFIPDRFVLVSEWSKLQFEKRLPLKVELDVWDYPIEDSRKLTKAEAQKILKFDPDYKHILNVGLFTKGKNQGEIFEVAKSFLNSKVKFHFVGNQAMNFEDYWGPLLKDKPSNCVIWGERNDTDLFYQAADMFYFSSVFELNPLVVKEALSFKIPILMRKLPCYLDTYDNNALISYIDSDKKKTEAKIYESIAK